jgi:AcrR family transcriptional regulator
MARAKSPEKRDAILEAATDEIAEVGLGAATAKIAARAGMATGSLFTYFPTKEDLLNELYLALKREMYDRVNADFPTGKSLEKRLRHVWLTYVELAVDAPAMRKTSLQLNVSDVITQETRARSAQGQGNLATVLRELEDRGQKRGLPKGFIAAAMLAMLETTADFSQSGKVKQAEMKERAFQAFWRMVR